MNFFEALTAIAGLTLFGWLIFNVRGCDTAREIEATKRPKMCTIPCDNMKELFK